LDNKVSDIDARCNHVVQITISLL